MEVIQIVLQTTVVIMATAVIQIVRLKQIVHARDQLPQVLPRLRHLFHSLEQIGLLYSERD